MKIKIYLETIRCYFITIGLLLLISGFSYAQSPGWLWAKAIGGLNNDYGNSITRDLSGNIIITGCFSGTADFDPGPATFNLSSAGLNDIFIEKMDASGNFIWAKRIGGLNNDYSWSVTTDPSGNIIFTGYYNGTIDFDPGAGTTNLTSTGYADIFICKLDSYGNFVWAKSMGGTDNDDYGYSVATDASGNIYTTGVFSGSADFDPGASGTYNLTSSGGPDIFISKLNSTGSFMWAKAIGGLDYENGFSIAIDISGNLYITGYFTGSVDFNPGPSQTFLLTSAGFFDAYILKLSAAGDFQWAKRMGGADDDFGSAITVDAAGNVYSVGHFQGTADFDPDAGTFNLTSVGSADIYISKLNSSGNFVWAKAVGGASYDDGFAIAVDGSGNVYTAGRFIGIVDFNPGTGISQLVAAGWGDIFILKLNSSGIFEWVKGAGGINDEACKSITIDASGYIFLTGNFLSPSIVFGTSSLSSVSGTSEIFVAKLDNTITGLADYSDGTGIFIYPNPVRDNFTITIPGNLQLAEISMVDMKGNEIPIVTTATLKGTTQEIMVTLPQAAVSDGIYFVRMTTRDFIVSKKLVIVE